MTRILILGAGKIGSLVATLLAQSSEYVVQLADLDQSAAYRVKRSPGCQSVVPVNLDARNAVALRGFMANHAPQAVVSCLPYLCNPGIAEVAVEARAHYFDLSEDIASARRIVQLAPHAVTAVVPQCGLAPGFISIVARELIGHFDIIDSVKMRVGALPVNPSNALKYSLTWSTDGLINEYDNPCQAIDDGRLVELSPLEGYETIELDGLLYEAFNTSGGLGTLADSYAGKVRSMNYKTLRYPGHCEKILFLLKDLRLREDRASLKRILERAVPRTLQDVVLVYVSVSGMKDGELVEENYVQKLYPRTIATRAWSAIQLTTAAALCAVLDLLLTDVEPRRGLVRQESFGLAQVLDNRFGCLLKAAGDDSGLDATNSGLRREECSAPA